MRLLQRSLREVYFPENIHEEEAGRRSRENVNQRGNHRDRAEPTPKTRLLLFTSSLLPFTSQSVLRLSSSLVSRRREKDRDSRQQQQQHCFLLFSNDPLAFSLLVSLILSPASHLQRQWLLQGISREGNIVSRLLHHQSLSSPVSSSLSSCLASSTHTECLPFF